MRSLIPFISILGILLTACAPTPVNPETPTIPSSPTPSPTATQMPTPTLTPTPRPTLSFEEGRLYFIEVLNTNAGCELPCFWGFTPGESKGAHIASFLKIFRVPTRSGVHRGYKYHDMGPFEHYKNKINNSIGFYMENGVIRDIAIETNLRRGGDPVEFRELWSNYFPTQVIANYGQPSRIFIEAMQPHQSYERLDYDLWLIYDDLGYLARYRGDGSPEYGAKYNICPSYDGYGDLIGDFEMYIQSPNLSTPVEDLSKFEDQSWAIHTLEEATGLTIEQFTSEYLDEGNTPCFETPVDIWPS